MSERLKIYVRREPTTDWYALQEGVKGKCDVVAYTDEAATKFVGRWVWANSPPRKGTKLVMLNCFEYEAVWLPDLLAVSGSEASK
jgi:hypothetical protein